MSLPNDQYGRTVTLSTDGITDTYTVSGGLTFAYPAGTSLAQVYADINSIAPPLSQMPLAMAKAQQIVAFQQAVQDYVTNAYSLDMRFNLLAIYQIAVADLLTNRAAYVFQIFSWANAVTQYAASYIATINGLSDSPTVASTLWDFANVSVPDPKITPIMALTINT